jgi:UDP-N-acetylglucosamine--N-acetylmuramyl-(pentapeptide) pyrophosphoryl-undecaprenol N-acetylglucosamine transferase
MKLLLAGGGTGGHLFPAIALAEQLKSEEPQSEVIFVGTEKGLEARMLPELGWNLKTIEMSGWAGLGVLARLKVLGKLTKSFAQSRKILREFNPDVVVGVGGYASSPTWCMSRMHGQVWQTGFLAIGRKESAFLLTRRIVPFIGAQQC